MDSILTHNGKITILNKKTGNHRTFKIETQSMDSNFAPGKRVLSLRKPGETDDYRSWMGFGFVSPQGIYIWKSKRSKTMHTYAEMLARPEKFEKMGCEYMFETRCRRCNRELTNPDSIKTGIGPICAQKESTYI